MRDLQFIVQTSDEPPGVILRLADSQGAKFAGERRFVQYTLTDHELITTKLNYKECVGVAIRSMVNEFNRYGKKIGVVPFKEGDDISNKLVLSDLGIALMYWSDRNGER